MKTFPPFILAMVALTAWRAIELVSFAPFVSLPVGLALGAAYVMGR